MTTLPHLTSALFDISNVQHGFFGRNGGASTGIYQSLNCGPGSDDNPAYVQENRKRCTNALRADNLLTAYQTHSAKAVFVETLKDVLPQGDGLVTKTPGLAIGILTADCIPALFHDPEAGIIGAAHAGWRGSLKGILENTVALMCTHGADARNIRAALGPSLQQKNFEVGLDLLELFTEKHPEAEQFFTPGASEEKRQLDLVSFGRERLHCSGLKAGNIETLSACTLGAPEDWFSYRHARRTQQPDYGRNLSAIMLTRGTP